MFSPPATATVRDGKDKRDCCGDPYRSWSHTQATSRRQRYPLRLRGRSTMASGRSAKPRTGRTMLLMLCFPMSSNG
jgi:hypothetical protein